MIQVYVEITNITWVGDHDGEIAYDNEYDYEPPKQLNS